MEAFFFFSDIVKVQRPHLSNNGNNAIQTLVESVGLSLVRWPNIALVH